MTSEWNCKSVNAIIECLSQQIIIILNSVSIRLKIIFGDSIEDNQLGDSAEQGFSKNFDSR